MATVSSGFFPNTQGERIKHSLTADNNVTRLLFAFQISFVKPRAGFQIQQKQMFVPTWDGRVGSMGQMGLLFDYDDNYNTNQ